jgi:hypothetical protein
MPTQIVSGLLPSIALSDEAFASRHRALRALLWAHLPLVIGVAAATGEATGQHATMLWVVIGAILLCAVVPDSPRDGGRGRSRSRAACCSRPTRWCTAAAA